MRTPPRTPLAGWARSYIPTAEPCPSSSLAAWFLVESQDSSTRHALVQFAVEDEAQGLAHVARVRSWVDPAAVPVIDAGVEGAVCWLVYGRSFEAAHGDLDPLAPHDLVTLGLEIIAVAQRAERDGLVLPELDVGLVIHDFLPDGTFRPRLIGIGTPGPRSNEGQLAASIGALLAASYLGCRMSELGPLTAESLRSHGGRLPQELGQALLDAVSGKYTTLEDLRADIARTPARSRRSARVGGTTVQYRDPSIVKATTSSVLQLAAVGPLVAVPPTEAAERKTKRWLWPVLVAAGALIALVVLLDPFGGSVEESDLAIRGRPPLVEPPVGTVVTLSEPVANAPSRAKETALNEPVVAKRTAPSAGLPAVESDSVLDVGAAPTPGSVNTVPPPAPERVIPAAEVAADPESAKDSPVLADTVELSNLTLTSRPSDAQVVLDGVVLGRTPLLIAQPHSRFPLRIRVEKAGHSPEVFALSDPRRLEAKVTLRPVRAAPGLSGRGSGDINLER